MKEKTESSASWRARKIHARKDAVIGAKEAVLTLRKAAMNRIEAACCLLVAALRGLWLKRVEIGRHFEAEIKPQSEAAKHYAPFSAGKKIFLRYLLETKRHCDLVSRH